MTRESYKIEGNSLSAFLLAFIYLQHIVMILVCFKLLWHKTLFWSSEPQFPRPWSLVCDSDDDVLCCDHHMLWPRGTRAPCDQSEAFVMVTWSVSTNQRPVFRPIFIHLSSSVCSSANLNYQLPGPPLARTAKSDQSEASIQVTWSAFTNQKPVFRAKSGDPSPLQRRSPHPRDTRAI